MSNLQEKHKAWKQSRRTNNAALWDLCDAVYKEVKVGKTRRILSDLLREGEDTVQDWARVGWLISYLDGKEFSVVVGEPITLESIWRKDILTYDHLLRAAKLTKSYEIDPYDILERLVLAMEGNQDALKMERDIEEAHEDENILKRRDLLRIGKRLKQNQESLKFRGITSKLDRAFALLVGRINQELGGSDKATGAE